ncbi:MAG: hypothetical protein IKV55_03245 [Oscillospiraceae bacterium]|nr:hypothetical protein [Oscillospiraceae bacterium]
MRRLLFKFAFLCSYLYFTANKRAFIEICAARLAKNKAAFLCKAENPACLRPFAARLAGGEAAAALVFIYCFLYNKSV